MGHISYSRGYGVANIFVLQSDTAFDKTYGQDAFKTLWNNCEIVIALPGQRGSDILRLLENTIGRESYVAENRSGNAASSSDLFGQTSFSEDGRSVFDSDEIRRSKQGILFLRDKRPIKVDVPAYAALDPFRDIAEINPFHGKPFLRPVEAWSKSSPNWPIKRIYLLFKRAFKKLAKRHLRIDPVIRKNRLKRRAWLFRMMSALCSFWWVGALTYLYFYTSILHSLVSGFAGGV